MRPQVGEGPRSMARVLHLISSNQRRGAETFGVELAADLTARGHAVEILAVAPSASGPFLDVVVAGEHRADPRGLARIVSAARRNDLIISFGSTSLQLAALAGLVARRPFVYRNIGDPAAWQSVRAAGTRVGAPLRRASGIVAVFPGAGTEITRRYGIDASRIRVIPRGVPADRFPVTTPQRRADARAALGLDPARPWALFLGALSEEKDPLAAIAAVAGHPEAGLLVCGDGPLAADVAAQALLPTDRLRLLGPVDDVRQALSAADVLLLTSRTEGVPGAAIEAGLTGLPVVASQVGGLPYLVDDGRTGLLVTPGDTSGFTSALTTAIARRDELGAAAAVRCRDEFSMAAVGAAWHEVVSALARRRRR